MIEKTVIPFFVFPSGYGSWKLPAYLVLFIAAYVMASNPRFEESIQKSRVPALLLGILTSLHQSVIVAIAFYVVGLDLIVIEKYLLVVLVSFPIIAALLCPISKINLLRFLFGLRMKTRSS